MSITLALGDITKTAADVIVNAANANLFAGGGVCGSIHRVGGPTIADECHTWTAANGSVPVGSAMLTGPGKLPARHLVHAVGPMWRGGSEGEADLLAKAYRSAIELADAQGARSIAFPSISTGIFCYPVEEAARVAVKAVRKELLFASHVKEAVFVLFDQQTYDAYAAALAGE